jgi:hypothetical protein
VQKRVGPEPLLNLAVYKHEFKIRSCTQRAYERPCSLSIERPQRNIGPPFVCWIETKVTNISTTIGS